MLAATNEDLDLCALRQIAHRWQHHLLGLGEYDKHRGVTFSVYAGRHNTRRRAGPGWEVAIPEEPILAFCGQLSTRYCWGEIKHAHETVMKC